MTFRILGGALLPVSGVNFNIFDIDRGSASTTDSGDFTYVDRINGIQVTLGNVTNIDLRRSRARREATRCSIT